MTEIKKTYNIEKLHEELMATGLPVAGCDSNGKVTYIGEPTKIQIESAEQIVKDHDPGEAKETIPNAEKLEALWLSLAKGDNSKLNELKNR